MARALLDAAVALAREKGAELVEGYPIEGEAGAAEAYTGVPSMFAAAGFEDVAWHGRRGIVRLTL